MLFNAPANCLFASRKTSFTTYTEQQLQLFKERLDGNLKIFYSTTMLADTQKLRVNIQRVEGQCLSASEVLENLNQLDKVKKSKQLKKRKNNFSETSDETQQHSQKRRKITKISRDAKSIAEFGKKHCQLKTTCGANLKFTQTMQIVEKFFCMKKYREPASDLKAPPI